MGTKTIKAYKGSDKELLMTKKVEIEISKWVNDADEKPQDVTERIKTFDDACRELGEGHPLVKEWQMCGQNLSPDLEAYLRLRIITAALNEGWKPQFTKDECRWYFWYDLITKKQYDNLSAEDKSRVVYRSHNGANSYGGVSCAIALYDSSNAYTFFSSRLAFKSEKLATYAGRQFAEIYADFCFKPEEEE